MKRVSSEGFLDSIHDLYQAVELNNRVAKFFDRAIFLVALDMKRKSNFMKFASCSFYSCRSEFTGLARAALIA